jgi:hypothetical protein
MARELVAPLAHLLKTQAAGALPAPTGPNDGVDITGWRSGNYGPTKAAVMLYGAPATVSDVVLHGYRYGRWHYLGPVFSGEARVVEGPTRGAADEVRTIGIFERLAVSATGAVSIAVDFEPLEVQA